MALSQLKFDDITDSVSKTKSSTRSRAYHAKERTGCETCKLRRVKCDETKPTCVRCSASGKVCTGYVQPLAKMRKKARTNFRGFKNAILPENTPLLRPFCQRTGYCTEDADHLDYFVARVLPQFCRFSSSNKWPQTCLAAAHTDPAIKRCCLAISSLHRVLARTTYDDSQKRKAEVFALEQYSKAVCEVKDGILHARLSPSVVQLACFLFIVYEFLQGRRDDMLLHLRNGLWMIRGNLSEEQPDDISQQLQRVSVSWVLYGRPRFRNSVEVLTLLSSPDIATDLEEFNCFQGAKQSLEALVGDVLRWILMIDYNMFTSDIGKQEYRDTLLSAFDRWRGLFERTSQVTDPPEKSSVAKLLLAQMELAWIFLDAYDLQRGTAYDAHALRFEYVVNLMESVFDTPADAGSFSVDLHVIPVLFNTILACRHPTIRRRALVLLRNVPQYEGVWNAALMFRVGQAIIDFEEQSSDPVSLASAPFEAIPEACRVRHFDIEDDKLLLNNEATLRF